MGIEETDNKRQMETKTFKNISFKMLQPVMKFKLLWHYLEQILLNFIKFYLNKIYFTFI